MLLMVLKGLLNRQSALKKHLNFNDCLLFSDRLNNRNRLKVGTSIRLQIFYDDLVYLFFNKIALDVNLGVL